MFSQVRDGEELHNRKLKRLFIFGYRVTSKLANRIVTTELRCICVRAFESPTSVVYLSLKCVSSGLFCRMVPGHLAAVRRHLGR